MQIFSRYSNSLNASIEAAYKDALNQKAKEVSTGHLLLGLLGNHDNIAHQALVSMNVNYKNVNKELERLNVQTKESSSFLETELPLVNTSNELALSSQARQALCLAHEVRIFFGKSEIEPEHVLLALVDLSDDLVLKILEELGANLTFLKRKILALTAQKDCLALSDTASQIKHIIINGLKELAKDKLENVKNISELSKTSGIAIGKLPNYSELVLMIATVYLPDILVIQVAYQRYLLDQLLELLKARIGVIDQEMVAGIVSTAAQNVRQEVRAAIEYLWSHEFRLINQIPSEAEYDLIGSVLEDLWWTHSEEIALNEVFDEALDDYRRKHVLNLQKRRLEISQRLAKLKTRLEDTLKQCFFKKSISA
jgi:ATP-dependent Clp protease ATP-binding subunit ClpA